MRYSGVVARPRRQSERRQGIIEAASRVIADRGYAGARVKDIASEAGLSPQSVLYYYPEVEQLLAEAVRHAVTRYVARRRETVDSLDEPVAQLRAMIRAGFPSPPEDVAIIYQSTGAIRNDPGLRGLVESLTAHQVELYRRVLDVGASCGVFRLAVPSGVIAANLVALEDAYGLYMLEGSRLTVDEAVANVSAFASLAVGVDLDGERFT